MGDITSLITTNSLQDIKISEAEIVQNLAVHANASLSKAHGWEFLYLPSPFLDAAGNDLSTYQDSNGDIAGHFIMRLTFNGVNYYAPLESSVLAGQPPDTGLTISTLSSLVTQAGNGTAWITQFVSAANDVVRSANSEILLPHTLLSHWEAHTAGIYAVIPQVTLDSSGHTVGRFIAKIGFQGQELWIPCDTRLGGPLQLPRISGFNVASPIFIESGAGDTPAYNVNFHPVALGGTKPITYSYLGYNPQTQQFDQVIPLNVPTYVFFVTHPTAGLLCEFLSATTGLFNTISGAPGGNSTSYVMVKCVATNPAGSTSVATTGQDLIMTIFVKDNAPTCFFFKTAENWQLPDHLVYDCRSEFYTRERRRGYKWMTHWGIPLMNRSKVFFNFMRYGMVKPFISWSAWRYRRAGKGWAFWPLCQAWLLLWKLLGKVVKRDYGNPPNWDDSRPLIVSKSEPRTRQSEPPSPPSSST